MSKKRLPYPMYNPFRPFVFDELDRRKNTLPVSTTTPFVRMTACTEDIDYNRRFFTLGLHGFSDSDYDMFDSSYGKSKDVVGYSYDITTGGNAKKRLHSSDMISSGDPNLEGLSATESRAVRNQIATFQQEQADVFSKTAQPIPGILSANVDRIGPFAPFIANVNWQCYNRGQLEFLRNHFMNVGQHVVLEWGHQHANKRTAKMLDFGDPDVLEELVECLKMGRKYIIDNYVEPNDGNYDFVVGAVGQFNVTYDSQRGIYNCMTRIVSPGEVIFGLNNNFTFIDTENATPTGNQRLTTIVDFFTPARKFDELINNYSNDKSLVADFQADVSRARTNVNLTTSDLGENLATNPADRQFVSWNFFTDKLLPEIFSLINADVSIKLTDLFDISFTNDSEYATEFTDETWVGYNENLKSVDPEVMVLATKDMPVIIPAFNGAGILGADGPGDRGKLSQGVWLNVGMIRNAFATQNTFVEAIRDICKKMSNASQNFWRLSLTWDEEVNRWRIIDLNFGTQPDSEFYTFNKVDETGSVGMDTLNVEIESAFPAEAVTQAMMYSRFKSATAEERASMLALSAKIGTPSTFIFSLNWSGLVDILDRAKQADKTDIGETTIQGSSPNTEPDTTRARVSRFSLASSGVASSAGAGPSQFGRPIGNNILTNNLSNNVEEPFEIGSRISNPRTVSINPKTGLADDLRPGQGGKPEDGAFAINTTRLLHPQFAKSFDRWKRSVETYVTGRSGERIKISITVSVRNGKYQANLKKLYGSNAASAGLSKHETGQAIDFAVTVGGIPIKINDYNNLYIWNQLKDHAERVTEGLDESERHHYATLRMIDRQGERHHIEMEGTRHPEVVPDEAFANGQTYEDWKAGNIPAQTYVKSSRRKQRDKNEYHGDIAPVDEQDTINKQTAILEKFGESILPMVELDASGMMNRIAKSGYDNHARWSNGYVTGFPTTTATTVKLAGMSGFTISDMFHVERLPYVFRQYGAFQVTEIKEEITVAGWFTNLRGYFKMIWLEGKK
jgi:hypothetical protein